MPDTPTEDSIIEEYTPIAFNIVHSTDGKVLVAIIIRDPGNAFQNQLKMSFAPGEAMMIAKMFLDAAKRAASAKLIAVPGGLPS